MKGPAALGPHFYQSHWNIVGQDIIKEVISTFNIEATTEVMKNKISY